MMQVGAGSSRSSAGQGMAAGVIIAALVLLILIGAGRLGDWLGWPILAAATHPSYYLYGMIGPPGGLHLAAQLIGALLLGAVAALAAGIPLVAFLFRRAAPALLVRVGTIALAAGIAASWLWSGGGQAPVQAALAALLAWLGSLFGLAVAARFTDEARRRQSARGVPDRALLGLPPVEAEPWDSGPR
jgi:hypothetical protein